MNRKQFISIGLALTILLAFAAQSNARMWGGSYGPMMGRAGTGYSGQAMTSSQQEEIEIIEEKYKSELLDKETAINDKVAELKTAEGKDSTTIGELNILKDELYSLEKDYWVLRNNVNQEISKNLGSGYYGGMGWGPGFCNWHDDHQGLYDNAPQMYSQRGQMRGYGRGWCRW